MDMKSIAKRVEKGKGLFSLSLPRSGEGSPEGQWILNSQWSSVR